MRRTQALALYLCGKVTEKRGHQHLSPWSEKSPRATRLSPEATRLLPEATRLGEGEGEGEGWG
ncbi:MAG: hypothetical protein M1380_00055 [Chloroflexi bacterium]|nr:hypothetical protein [Chloroflexota bacterium]